MEQRLLDILQGHAWLPAALRAVRQLGLQEWAIGAGALRNIAWDALSGLPASMPADIDVAYFDAGDLSPERDARLQQQLQSALPGLPWEVSNQAAVHLWFEDCFGYPAAPLGSLAEAVASWPETCTAVAVYLDAEDKMRVIAPFGLEDLMRRVVRHNPARATRETYLERVAAKRYAERWPGVTVLR